MPPLGTHLEPDLCRTCPVPGIDRANACEFMRLRGEVVRPLSAAFRRRVKVTPFCEKTKRSGFDLISVVGMPSHPACIREKNNLTLRPLLV